MDNLAHTLIGIGVARSGLSRRFGPGTTFTLAVSSNLPDMDVLWTMWDRWDRFMLRRTHSHALLALPVLAAALAWLLCRRYPQQRWSVLFGLSGLGIALHLLFDLVNSFGVVILWPFTLHRFELSSVFIVDLCIWGITLLPLVAAFRLRSDRAKELAYRVSLGALGIYVALCLAASTRAKSLVREELARKRVEASALRVFPEPLGPQRFRVAARIGRDWNVYLCSLLWNSAELRAVVPSDDAAPRVAQIRSTPRGEMLDRFMSAPVWTVHPDGAVDVYDLRFSNLVLARTPVFHVEFAPGRVDPGVR